MNIDDNIIPILGILAGVTIVAITKLTQYRLKVEQIRADALVRAEEVKARNQLEIEKLMMRDQEKYQQRPHYATSQEPETDPYNRKMNNDREKL